MRRLQRTIEEVGWTKAVPTFAKQHTVAKAFDAMSREAHDCVLVVDGETLVGIFTSRDFLNRVAAVRRDPREVELGDVMTAAPKTLRPRDPVAFAINWMAIEGFRNVPIVDDAGAIRGVLTVWDVMRVMDYLTTRPDVDSARIGVVGISKGGTEAYLAAAADERIAAVASLIGVQSFGWSLRHAAAWEARAWTLRAAIEAAAADSGDAVSAPFVRKFFDRITPGLVDSFDGPMMLAAIAPRPLLVVNGDSDPRSPVGGVRQATASAERAYAAAGAREKFEFILEVDAAHEVTRDASRSVLDWFVRWLSPVKN